MGINEKGQNNETRFTFLFVALLFSFGTSHSARAELEVSLFRKWSF